MTYVTENQLICARANNTYNDVNSAISCRSLTDSIKLLKYTYYLLKINILCENAHYRNHSMLHEVPDCHCQFSSHDCCYQRRSHQEFRLTVVTNVSTKKTKIKSINYS